MFRNCWNSFEGNHRRQLVRKTAGDNNNRKKKTGKKVRCDVFLCNNYKKCAQ